MSAIEPTLTVPQAMAVEAALTLRLFRLQSAAALLATDPFALVVNQYAQRDSGAALAAVREALYGDPSGPEPDEPTWDLADHPANATVDHPANATVESEYAR